MKEKLLRAVMVLAILSSMFTAVPSAEAAEAIPAFPGAEGGGMYATGGRGGTVVHVTNLNDSGPGSLRDAVSHTNRIVVFDVGGTINLKSDISCAGNVTIAGQTAPGGRGVTLRGGKMAFGGDNIIARFISSRPGEKGTDSDYDAWGGGPGVNNTIIDHCSIGWANDEQFGLYSDNTNQTVQYTIVGPSNCVSYHSKGAHGFGVMFGSGKNSWHHNLLCHSLSRNFRGKVGGTSTMDFVNNVIYDWGYQTAYGTMGHINYVGNYLKMGPSTKGGQYFLNMSSGTHYENFRFYLTGNKIMRPDGTPYNEALNNDNWNGGINYGSHGGESDYRSDEYFWLTAPNGTDVSVAPNAETADEAFETVTSYAGASIDPADNAVSGYDYNSDASRNKIDAQVLYETRTGTGSLTGARDFSTVTDSAVLEAIEKYGIQQVDYNLYYPEAITEKEIIDSDNDGMPDEWELKRGLDPNNASDATEDYLGQGYNNIEYYINDLTVNAFPEGTVTVSPELVELGEDYVNAKADAEAITLPVTSVKDADDLTLPTVGSNGSSISWSGGSPYITISDNKITKVERPSTGNSTVTLTASVTCGDFTLKRSFSINVLAMPYKFDFGGGAAQAGYAPVSADTIYSADSTYGFTSTGAENMTRAPGNIPEGYEDVYADQVLVNGHFKTELPNGKYYVMIHYGSWNDGFGVRYNVEGVDSGNLASTDAAQYIAEVEVTDGVLDVEINKGNKSYGGYICGLEISTTRPAAPSPKYHYDFGNSDVLQDGYTGVTASTAYSMLTGYGFADTVSAPEAATRAADEIPAGYENLYADQIICESTFKVDLPNGKYAVTVHYGCWNDSFGANYTIEGKSSGNLASTTAAEYTTTAEVTDGTLDVVIAKGSKNYGGYISGLDIMPLPTLPYHFDFGDGDVQEGYTAVTSSTLYSELEYGFADGAVQEGMSRAPGEIPAGSEALYNDQIMGETQFKVNVPDGRYKIVIYYGSWNEDFGVNYTIEGVSSGDLASTTAAQYTTTAEVTDGVLDIDIGMGGKKYGGYISGMDITQLPTLPYHFDFGDGEVQDGYTAVTSSTMYSDLSYGFADGAVQSGMTRAPYDIPAGSEALYNDQISGETRFRADVPNGNYDIVIYYGSWNEDFGVNYTIEGVSSGDLASTSAAKYTTTAEVTDGVLDIDIGMGDKEYGGYISGIDITPAGSEPTGEPSEMPYVSSIAFDNGNAVLSAEGADTAPEAAAVIAQYDADGRLISVKLQHISGTADISAALEDGTGIVKGFIWNVSAQKPLSQTAAEDL